MRELIFLILYSFFMSTSSAFRLINPSLRRLIRQPAAQTPVFKVASTWRISNSVTRLFSSMGEDTVVARCTEQIKAMLKPVKLQVTSSNDDPNGAHINVECVSTEFEGLNSMKRQRLVYKALWDELSTNRVHAVDSIVAKTPSEVGM